LVPVRQAFRPSSPFNNLQFLRFHFAIHSGSFAFVGQESAILPLLSSAVVSDSPPCSPTVPLGFRRPPLAEQLKA
jgi:hypothetical protein